jgi:tripartite ATP-independent transporter DctM subunit
VTLAILWGLFAVFLVIGTPVGYAMGLSAALALLIEGRIPLLIVPQRMFAGMENFALLAVPLFILAGELMNAAGITARLVALSRALVGHIKGGLAQVNILTNMFMAAISGSAAADLAAIGSMLIPAMTRHGYKREFTVAVTSCAALMGPIIPPSLVAVIYGSMTGVSIGGLFLAGAIPGLLAGLAMMLITRLLSKHAGGVESPRAPAAERAAALRGALPALLMPVLIIGGILGGAFTPTEAGAIAAFYAFAYGVARRQFDGGAIYRMLLQAAVTTASALITLGGATLFGWVLSRSGFANLVLGGLFSVTTDPTLCLLIILAFLFLLGTAVETVPGIILSIPVLLPIAQRLGYDPVHFGVLVIMMMVLGSVTPPVGVLAMLACRMAGVEYSRTFGYLAPYTLAWVAIIVLTALVPPIALWLPQLLLPQR